MVGLDPSRLGNIHMTNPVLILEQMRHRVPELIIQSDGRRHADLNVRERIPKPALDLEPVDGIFRILPDPPLGAVSHVPVLQA